MREIGLLWLILVYVSAEDVAPSASGPDSSTLDFTTMQDILGKLRKVDLSDNPSATSIFYCTIEKSSVSTADKYDSNLVECLNTSSTSTSTTTTTPTITITTTTTTSIPTTTTATAPTTTMTTTTKATTATTTATITPTSTTTTPNNPTSTSTATTSTTTTTPTPTTTTTPMATTTIAYKLDFATVQNILDKLRKLDLTANPSATPIFYCIITKSTSSAANKYDSSLVECLNTTTTSTTTPATTTTTPSTTIKTTSTSTTTTTKPTTATSTTTTTSTPMTTTLTTTTTFTTMSTTKPATTTSTMKMTTPTTTSATTTTTTAKTTTSMPTTTTIAAISTTTITPTATLTTTAASTPPQLTSDSTTTSVTSTSTTSFIDTSTTVTSTVSPTTTESAPSTAVTTISPTSTATSATLSSLASSSPSSSAATSSLSSVASSFTSTEDEQTSTSFPPTSTSPKPPSTTNAVTSTVMKTTSITESSSMTMSTEELSNIGEWTQHTTMEYDTSSAPTTTKDNIPSIASSSTQQTTSAVDTSPAVTTVDGTSEFENSQTSQGTTNRLSTTTEIKPTTSAVNVIQTTPVNMDTTTELKTMTTTDVSFFLFSTAGSTDIVETASTSTSEEPGKITERTTESVTAEVNTASIVGAVESISSTEDPLVSVIETTTETATVAIEKETTIGEVSSMDPDIIMSTTLSTTRQSSSSSSDQSTGHSSIELSIPSSDTGVQPSADYNFPSTSENTMKGLSTKEIGHHSRISSAHSMPDAIEKSSSTASETTNGISEERGNSSTTDSTISTSTNLGTTSTEIIENSSSVEKGLLSTNIPKTSTMSTASVPGEQTTSIPQTSRRQKEYSSSSSEESTTDHPTTAMSNVSPTSNLNGENTMKIQTSRTASPPSFVSPTSTTPVGTSSTSFWRNNSKICPLGYEEGENYCYIIVPSYQSQVSNIRTGNATSRDLFWINMHQSKSLITELMVPLVNLTNSSAFTLSIIRAKITTQLDQSIGICRAPKYGALLKCDTGQIYSLFGYLLPSPATDQLSLFDSGMIFNQFCLPPATNNLTAICSNVGQWNPHPTRLACVDPNAPTPPRPEKVTTSNKPVRESCDECYIAGTANCTAVDGGYKCNCKEGWTKFTCWLAPDVCTTSSCNGHGKCKKLGDTFECLCDAAYTGTTCQIKIYEISALGDNNTVPVISAGAVTAGISVGNNMLILCLKLVTKIAVMKDSTEPIEQFQQMRVFCLALGSTVVALYARPSLFLLNTIARRFAFFMEHGLFGLAFLFYYNEAIQVWWTVSGRNRNEWEIDSSGSTVWYMSFWFRMFWPLPVIFFCFAAIFNLFWDSLTSSWSTVGLFGKADITPMFILVLLYWGNAIGSASYGLAAWKSLKIGPNYMEMCYDAELKHHERIEDIIRKVGRNVVFMICNPLLLAISWLFLSLSYYYDTFWFNFLSILSSMVYSVFSTAQAFLTHSGNLEILLIKVVFRWFPDWKRLPRITPLTRLTREEVRCAYKKQPLTRVYYPCIPSLDYWYLREEERYWIHRNLTKSYCRARYETGDTVEECIFKAIQPELATAVDTDDNQRLYWIGIWAEQIRLHDTYIIQNPRREVIKSQEIAWRAMTVPMMTPGQKAEEERKCERYGQLAKILEYTMVDKRVIYFPSQRVPGASWMEWIDKHGPAGWRPSYRQFLLREQHKEALEEGEKRLEWLKQSGDQEYELAVLDEKQPGFIGPHKDNDLRHFPGVWEILDCYYASQPFHEQMQQLEKYLHNWIREEITGEHR